MPRYSTTSRQPAARGPQFVLFTTPIQLSSLDSDSRTCPICSEPYIEPRQTPPSSDETEEWAIRLDMSAAVDGHRRCCGHIFGRRCLEKHINSPGAWRNKCPLCRCVLFKNDSAQRASSPAPPMGATANAGVPALAPYQPHGAQRLASSLSQRMHTPRAGRRSSGSGSRTARSPRSSDFIRNVLDTLAVQDGSGEVRASRQEVERRLDQLYGDLERRRRRPAEE